MGSQLFSYGRGKSYYSKNWPQEAVPYLQARSYLECWMDPREIFEGRRVLDIGAGECVYSRLIADQYGPDQIVACDLFRERLLPAARENRNHRLKCVAGDGFRLPIRDGAVDVVFGGFVLHQLRKLDRVARGIRRVLAGGGLYVGIEPSPYNPVYLYRYYFKAHSSNQFILLPRHLAALKREGFGVTLRFFCARFPSVQNRVLATCMGIIARRLDS